MKEKQNNSEMDWTLVGKYLSGEATPTEVKQVEDWSNQSDENLAELQKNRQLLENVDEYYLSKKFNSNKAWQKVQSKANGLPTKTVQLKSSRKEILARYYKYAAVILVAITLGFAGYYFGFKNQNTFTSTEIISAEKQVLNEYILPDGSLVTLNSNSKLIFPKKFKNDVREVTITGEAFFDVQPNPEKPFIIHAGNAQVKVLGTSFNVRAYPENETVEIVVETGKVQVAAENKEETMQIKPQGIILSPGEKGIVYYNSRKPEKSINTNHNIIAWKTRNLVFDETPLKEVVTNLERVYHIKIQLNEQELNDLTLTATFDKKPPEFVLNVIQLTFNLELITENGLFILSNQKNDQVKH